MTHPLLHLLTALTLLSLSACTSFNLTEQLSNRRVPVVIPEKGKAVYYERNGKYYSALTVAMAEEHIPLLSSRNKTPNTFYHGTPTYTPDMSTAQTYLFELTDVETEVLLESIREVRSGYKYRSRPVRSKDKPGYIPPMVKAEDFDFANARRFTHTIMNERDWIATRHKQFTDESPYEFRRKEQNGVYPYPIAALPSQELPRSLGQKAALPPVWVLDTAGNLVLNTVEATVIGAGTILASPFIGLLYLCGESLP